MPRLRDQATLPQCARGLVENLRVDLLLTEGCALVLVDDLAEECCGQVRRVVVRRASGDDCRFAFLRFFDQVADRAYRARGGGDDYLRVITQAQAEHQLVPRFGVLPRCHLVAPCEVMLRPSKFCRIVP